MLFEVEVDSDNQLLNFVVKSPLNNQCALDLVATVLTTLATSQLKAVVLDVALADPVSVDAIRTLERFSEDLVPYSTEIGVRSPSEETAQLLKALNSTLL